MSSRHGQVCRLLAGLAWIGLACLTAGCQAGVLSPPRLVTLTAQAGAAETPTPEAALYPAPTATAMPGQVAGGQAPDPAEPAPADSITVWVNETSAEHEAAIEEIARGFSQQSDLNVERVLIAPDRLPGLVATAALSGTLPDVVLHPADYSLLWAEENILDPAAATAVVADLGRASFDPAALAQMALPGPAGEVAAVPSAGWQQLIVYRQDWFAELGLAPPDRYQALIAAAQSNFRPENNVSGLVVPTDAALVSTQQVFEQMAAANGCELVDARGEVQLIEAECLDALDFYFRLINQFSPVGLQTGVSAWNAYLAGRTSIIMTSPAVLPVLAGLDEEFLPRCPACDAPGFLVGNSGILTTIQGNGEGATPTNFGQLTALGITTAADRPAAEAFAAYWFEDGYATWLAVDPARKAPLRWGTQAEPRRFINAWGDLELAAGGPSLRQLYGDEIVSRLGSNVASAGRWGFDQGQGALAGRVYNELVLAPLLQEMLSGYFTPGQTILEMYHAVLNLIPGYDFSVVEPTPADE
ncbi:MAG: ABC transporter substrate-binding protein [Candidatus Promineifilaceae bacterium]